MLLVLLLTVSYCLPYIITIHCKCNDQHEYIGHDACVQWLQSCQLVIDRCGWYTSWCLHEICGMVTI